VIDPWTVEIEATDGSKQRLTTRSIVIAAGAQPFGLLPVSMTPC